MKDCCIFFISLSNLQFELKGFSLQEIYNSKRFIYFQYLLFNYCQYRGPSINGLFTDGNAKLCCQGFVLVLFQSTTAHKIDSEYTKAYKKLLPVCKVEILQVTVNRIEDFEEKSQICREIMEI